jgi:putative tryptophan/tyrosine transport system substrate-binding protein
MLDLRRRDFIALLGGTAAAWPVVARAQQSGSMRRIGVLLGYAENDPSAQPRLAAFREGLHELGWREGHNIRIDVRFGAADPDRMRAHAAELVAMRPDVVLGMTTPVTGALLRLTRSIPIVFVIVSDPVGSGFVESLAHPGGNATGFINLESSLVEKWIELLKEIAPQTSRAAMMFNPETAPYAGYYMRPFEAAARLLAVEPIGAPVRDDADIERVIAGLARDAKGGLILLTDIYTTARREPINRLTARYRIPAVNSSSIITRDGGLITYGVDTIDLFRRAAPYIDRILKGSKPGELPVQVPTRFEVIVNLKTAKALGVTIPPSVMLRADEVIE